MSGALKEKSEERRRAWLGAQTPERAAQRIERATALLGEYDAPTDLDESASWADEHCPLWTEGDLASRVEEHIARAAEIARVELTVDAGTLALWLVNLPLNRQRKTVANIRLLDLTVPLVFAHLLTLELDLPVALARAVARRVVLIALNKRNAAKGHGGEYLKLPFWVPQEPPKRVRQPRAKSEATDGKQPEPAPPTNVPALRPQQGTTIRHGQMLFTVADTPEGDERDMCFSCGAPGGPSLKRRITVQVVGEVQDYGALLVDFLAKSKELAKGQVPPSQCPKCGASVAVIVRQPEEEKEEQEAARVATESARQVIGRVRTKKPMDFWFGKEIRRLEEGTECERLKLTGKEMFPPAEGSEEQVGIRWEGRLRFVPMSSVEVLEVAS